MVNSKKNLSWEVELTVGVVKNRSQVREIALELSTHKYTVSRAILGFIDLLYTALNYKFKLLIKLKANRKFKLINFKTLFNFNTLSPLHDMVGYQLRTLKLSSNFVFKSWEK